MRRIETSRIGEAAKYNLTGKRLTCLTWEKMDGRNTTKSGETRGNGLRGKNTWSRVLEVDNCGD